MARLGFLATRTAAALGLLLLLAEAITAVIVTSPSDTWTVIGNRPYKVEWESTEEGRGGNNEVDIDLYYCGDSCQENDCGEWVANLCVNDPEGCATTDYAHEVLMPMPIRGRTSWGYKIRVTDGRSSPMSGCSEEFTLVPHLDMLSKEELDQAFLMVTSPVEGDLAVAGEDYTIEFYDFNPEDDKLMIDLYMSGGRKGDCGAWVGPLCDDPDVGCRDSGSGSHDISIPSSIQAGWYSIGISRSGKRGYAFACSGEFEVVSSVRPTSS